MDTAVPLRPLLRVASECTACLATPPHVSWLEGLCSGTDGAWQQAGLSCMLHSLLHGLGLIHPVLWGKKKKKCCIYSSFYPQYQKRVLAQSDNLISDE